MSTTSHRFPLNLPERFHALVRRKFDQLSSTRIVKRKFWARISWQAEFQRLNPELYGQIEHELEWVNVSHFKTGEHAFRDEEIYLHRIVGFLESSSNGIPANGFQPKTYVIPYRGSLPGEVAYYGGIPEDVCLLRVYTPWPYPKYSLRDEHLAAQAFYSDQLAEHPLARREKFCTKVQHHVASNLGLFSTLDFFLASPSFY